MYSKLWCITCRVCSNGHGNGDGAVSDDDGGDDGGGSENDGW